MQVTPLRGMKRSFRGRQGKNKPAVTGVHRRKFENIAKESAVAFRVLAVNDYMSAGNHRSLILTSNWAFEQWTNFLPDAATATAILDRFLQIPPTITIREGHRVKVYFTQDMLLPAYSNHTIPETF